MDISRAIWNLIFFLGAICSLTGLTAARGARGGGFRGGSSYRSSGSSYRSSGSSYRSSARYSSSYARSGSRVSSTYVSYVPSVRYSRAYSSSRIGSGYWYYYGLYFSYARSSYYMRRRRPYSSNVEVCVNYETDSSISTTNGTTNSTTNSTTLGIFTCPLLDEEPRTYTKCCGDQYAEYCCEKTTDHGVAIAFGVIGGIVGICALIALVCYCKKKQSYPGRTISVPRDNSTGISHTQSSGPNRRYRPTEDNSNNVIGTKESTGYFNGATPYPTGPTNPPPNGYTPYPPTAAPMAEPTAAPPYPAGGPEASPQPLAAVYPPVAPSYPAGAPEYPPVAPGYPTPAYPAPYPAEPPPTYYKSTSC